MLDAQTKETLNVEWMPGGPDGLLALAQVTADRITRLWVDGGRPGAPLQKLIGGPGAPFGNKHQQLWLSFNTEGKLATVIPTKTSPSRQNMPNDQVFPSGAGTYTLRGDFVGAYDLLQDQDKAPHGAAAVVLDGATGRVLAVE